MLEPVNEELGYPVCDLCGCVDGCLLEKRVEDGIRKLQHIIDRESDADGERRQGLLPGAAYCRGHKEPPYERVLPF